MFYFVYSTKKTDTSIRFICSGSAIEADRSLAAKIYSRSRFLRQDNRYKSDLLYCLFSNALLLRPLTSLITKPTAETIHGFPLEQ